MFTLLVVQYIMLLLYVLSQTSQQVVSEPLLSWMGSGSESRYDGSLYQRYYYW